MESSVVLSYPRIVSLLRTSGCVYAEEEARLLIESADTTVELEAAVRRRAAGLPLEHILGWAEFCGLRIAVHPGVFVPRLRTSFLVATAVDALSGHNGPRPLAVDLCCGSGAVGVALLASVPSVELAAVDIDPAAVQCARANLVGANGVVDAVEVRGGGARVTVYEGDLFSPLPVSLQERVDVLMVNAPYVPTSAIELLPSEARLHEPQIALDGGADGLGVLRRVLAQAPTWLAPGGRALFETSADQAEELAELATRHGLTPAVAHSPELNATVLVAVRSA